MKKSIIISAILSAALIISLFCGCEKTDNTENTTKSISAYEGYCKGYKNKINNNFIINYLKENPKFECSAYSVGDTLVFGCFEQDNNKNNGAEPIEWTVLEADNMHLLLISKYGLYPASYHWENTKYKYTTWETSSIRQWLNGKFYENSFSDEEKSFIALNRIINKDNEKYGIEGGKDTDDYVYFLSYDEVLKYLPGRKQRRAKPTEYAIAKGAHTNDAGYGYWWLRTPGIFRCNAEYVFEGGEIYEYGSDVGHDNLCCRPVIRIEHNAVNK